MKPRPRKIITRVIVFLLLGAIVNVAVAWGQLIHDVRAQRVRLRDTSLTAEQMLHAQTQRLSTRIKSSNGFPVRSMHRSILTGDRDKDVSTSTWDNGIWIDIEQMYLPIRPILPGFAINTIFYAAILGLLFFAPGSVRRAFRRRRGLCPACAYPIGTSPVCTECGAAVRSRS